MPKHQVGTREEWSAARTGLLEREQELATVGTDLASWMAESPGWNVFALEDGVVYRTYSRTAPDRFLLAPYYDQLLDQAPAGRDGDFPLRRHNEY